MAKARIAWTDLFGSENQAKTQRTCPVILLKVQQFAAEALLLYTYEHV